MARTQVSKKLRFDVLERDGFRCRYCGAEPNDGALHVDHIIPVAEDGATAIDNLIASCEPCNSGKGKRVIGAAQPLPDFAAMTAEAKATTAELTKWSRAHKKREDTLTKAAEQIITDHNISVPLKTIKGAIRDYGIAEVDYAADVMSDRIERQNYQGQVSYLFGVLHKRANEESKQAPMPEYIKPAPTLHGGCPLGSKLTCPDGMKSACITEVDGDIDMYCRWLGEGIKKLSGEEFDYLLYSVSDFVQEWRSNPRKAIISAVHCEQILVNDAPHLLSKVTQ